MNPLQRRKMLQTGLAGAGVLGAVAISLGLAGTTHTASGAQGGAVDGTRGAQHAQTTQKNRESDDDRSSSTSRTPSSTQASSNPSVSAPQSSPPQATTSGS